MDTSEKTSEISQSDEAYTELHSVEQILATDGYMNSTVANIKANLDLGIYEKDNVYSIHGLMKELRSSFQKAIFINPGTSIDRHIEELVEKSKNPETVVLCSDVCLPGLLSVGVNVRYVITLDPNPKTSYFIENTDLSSIGVIASSASPLYRYYTPETEFYLFNSLEETKDFIIRPTESDKKDPKSLLGVTLMMEKSRRINEILRDAGIFRKYTHYLARGTVAITMFQVASDIRIPTEFYGFDFYIKKDQPYADVISRGVYNKLVSEKVFPKEYSFDDYISGVVQSYYENKLDDEQREKTRIDHLELGTIYVPPLLALYKDLFLHYISLTGNTGKNMKFIG
jgi:hypothetical protein